VIELICQRYHCLPDEARKADASILRHIAILEAAHGELEPEPVAPPLPERELAAMSYALSGGA
jgi:hypothetical protein